jgi:Protein of unknown function (DUF3107)
MIEVRIGMIQVPRELSVEVDEDPDTVVKRVSEAASDPEGLLWLTDSKGKRIGITVAKLAYIEVEPDASPRSVGFSR